MLQTEDIFLMYSVLNHVRITRMLFAIIEHVIAATRTESSNPNQRSRRMVAKDEYTYICALLDDHIKEGFLITYFVKVPEPNL